MGRAIFIFIFLWYVLSTLPALDKGNTLPDIRLPNLINDKLIHVNEELGGKIIVISFFTGYCFPCKKEIPQLQKLQSELGRNVHIILIASDDDKERIQRFLKGMNISLATFWDKNSKVAEDFKVSSFPTLFLFDKQGKLALKIDGYNPSAILVLKNQIEKDLK